jgi:hypothetical protein
VTDDLKCFADVADAMSQSQPDRASGRPVFQPSSGRTQPSATSNTPLLAHTGLFARITSHEPSPTSSGVSSSNAAATDAIARSD